MRNRAQTKHLLRCEGEDAQHDHRRLKGNKERTAAQERLDDNQVKRASKRVRFRVFLAIAIARLPRRSLPCERPSRYWPGPSDTNMVANESVAL